MKLPRKTFEFVDSSLITSSPTKVRLEWYLSLTTVCVFILTFVLWNSPGWLYYANVAYLQVVLTTVLIGIALTFLWIVLTAERVIIKKVRIKKYKIELGASIVTLPFEFFFVSVLVDFITNFRMISYNLQGMTAGFILASLLLLSLWSAFSLERWHAIKRKLSGEEEEDVIWVQDWVDEYEKEEDSEEEEEYVTEDDFEEIDYSM